MSGASQPQTKAQAQPVQKSGGHIVRNVIIGVVAVALLAGAGFGVFKLVTSLMGGNGGGVGLFASAEEQFVGYQQSTLTDRALTAMESAIESYGSGKLSTDLTLSLSVKGNDELQDLLEDSSVVLSLDLDKDNLLANAELVLMGSPVISGMVTYDKGTVGFYLPELDKNYYTADLSKLVKNLTGESVDLSGLSLPTVSGKEWSALLQDYLDIFYGVVNEDSLEIEKKESFRMSYLKGSYEGTVFTFTPRAEDIEEMFLDLAGHLEKDKNLRRMLLELFNVDGLTAAFGDDIFDGMDMEAEIDDLIAELVEQLEDNAADVAEQLEDMDLAWTLCLEGKEVRRIALTWEDSGDEMTIAYEREGNESKGVTEVFYAMEDEYTAFVIEHSYTKKGSSYSGKMELISEPDTDYEEGLTLKYETDTSKKSALGFYYGSYELIFPVYDYYNNEYVDASMVLEVSEAGKGSVDHVFTIKNVDVLTGGDSEGIERIDITINATDKCSAKAPSSKEVDISKYDEDELEELFMGLAEEAEEQLEGVLGDLQRAMGMSGTALPD